MTSLTQIKRLANPILAKHEDLELIGRWLVLKPVHHVFRGVVIASSGEARRFRPFWAVVDICEPRERPPLNWGEMFGHPTNNLWFWDDPTIVAAFLAVLNGTVLPILRAIQTLDQFYEFASGERFFPGPFDAFPLSAAPVQAARGQLDSARAMCAKLTSGPTRWSAPMMRDRFDQITKPLCPLLAANDRAGIAAVLHRWEVQTVKNLRLESVWEKTPFPLELLPA